MARVAKLVTTGDVAIKWAQTQAATSLTNGAFASGASWTLADDFAIAAGKATYTHSVGAGTLKQLAEDLAIALVPGENYVFTYTVSGTSGDITLFRLALETGQSIVALDSTNGTHTASFTPITAGDVVITINSDSGGLSLDDLSLQKQTGPNFDGTAVMVLNLPSGNQAYLNNEMPGLRIPGYFPVPIKDGVYDENAKLLWRSAISPPSTTYTPKFYDAQGLLIATGEDFTVADDATEVTLNPPTLTAPQV